MIDAEIMESERVIRKLVTGNNIIVEVCLRERSTQGKYLVMFKINEELVQNRLLH